MVIVPSDDLLFPWSVATVVECFRTRSEVDVVHGDWLTWDTTHDVWHLRLNKPFEFAYLTRTNWLTPQATYFRRRALESEGALDLRWPHACDYEWLLRVTKGREVASLSEILAVYSKRPGAVLRYEGAAEAVQREVEEIRARYLNTKSLFHRRFSE